MEIKLKRVYDPPETGDGFRILVDRIWPRGISREKAALNEWTKEVAPSTELRRNFHQNSDWAAFKKAYLGELAASEFWPDFLSLVKKHSVVTLVYASKDQEHNQAVVLRDQIIKSADFRSPARALRRRDIG